MIQDTGCLGLVHWDDPERWYGEGDGRRVQDWEHVHTHGGFMLMYGKTQYCKVKSSKKKKKHRKTTVDWHSLSCYNKMT